MNRLTEKERETREKREAQLDDLATGQINLLTAMRLRREIARDPELARIGEDVRQLRAELQSLAPTVVHRHQKIRRHRTFTIGGLTMQRRTAAFAAGAITFLSVSGALAAHYWTAPEADCGFPGTNRDTEWWWLHGTFRGNAALVAPDGSPINHITVEGQSPEGALKFRYTRKDRAIAEASLSGMGKHPVLDHSGNLIGYLLLSPLTSDDEQQIDQTGNEIEADMQDYYQRPERVTPDDEKRGFAAIVPLPDMVGGQIMELVASHDAENFHDHSVSWKTYGDVQVHSRFYAPAEAVVVSSSGRPNTWTVHLPARTLVDEAQSMPIPTESQLGNVSPEERRVWERLNTGAHRTPETYWAIADPKAGLNHKNGEWKRVLQSGKFAGYGHFLIRDTARRVVLSLDVTRPVRKPGLTPEQSGDTVKPQKVVPGWDGEE